MINTKITFIGIESPTSEDLVKKYTVINKPKKFALKTYANQNQFRKTNSECVSGLQKLRGFNECQNGG